MRNSRKGSKEALAHIDTQTENLCSARRIESSQYASLTKISACSKWYYGFSFTFTELYSNSRGT